MPEKVGNDPPGAAGFEPHFLCAHTQTPLPTAPKDVATLSLTVLKDSERAARPVGRYLLHAKSYRVSGPCPQLLCGWVFFVFFVFFLLLFLVLVFSLCGILSPSLPLIQEIAWVRRGTPGKIERALGKNHVEHFWFFCVSSP